MIVSILSVLLFLVFAVLSGFHFYWIFGGTFGINKVIPTKEGATLNKQVIPPVATLVVALGLLFFGLLYLLKGGFISVPLPNWVIAYGTWFVPSIFLLRAIGDFNYVGFFKKVRNTDFAKADSTLFSPLCLGIGASGFAIQLLDGI